VVGALATNEPMTGIEPTTDVRPRPRVLIAEDDEDTREMYAWAMRAGGWIVETVATGADALFAATQALPDVIVMDLYMPAIDGLEALRRLRTRQELRDTPVVALTGVDPSRVEAFAREAGCTAFVSKPCLPEDLRALLEDLLTARARAAR